MNQSLEMPRYFVMPGLPRDVWYGYPEKPDSAQLVCFVEQRHAYISPGFDAELITRWLNHGQEIKEQLVAMTNEYAKSMKDAGVTAYPEALHIVQQARKALAALDRKGGAL